MKAVIQRVLSANVEIGGKNHSAIGPGLLTLLGVEKGDNPEKLQKLIKKILSLRIFEDEHGKMNRSLLDIKGEHLIVSQFTLLGSCHKGNRPSFENAEAPQKAKILYLKSLEISQSLGAPTQAGEFQAPMKIQLLNDGPVTFFLET